MFYIHVKHLKFCSIVSLAKTLIATFIIYGFTYIPLLYVQVEHAILKHLYYSCVVAKLQVPRKESCLLCRFMCMGSVGCKLKVFACSHRVTVNASIAHVPKLRHCSRKLLSHGTV